MNRRLPGSPEVNPVDLIYGTSQDMHDGQEIDFLQYWRVIRKHLLGIIGLSIAVGILAMIVASSLTPVYTASTKVSIEHVSPSTGAYADNNWYSMRNYPGTQYQFIKSSAVAEQLVENLKLWEHPWFKNNMNKEGFNLRRYIPFLPEKQEQVEQQSDEELLKIRKDGITNMVKSGIVVTPIKDTFIVSISFSSPSPDLAALIANSVVDAYIQRNLEARFKEVKKISDWMNKSLGGIATQLDSSETKLQSYRSRENLVDVGKGASGFLTQGLDELSNRLTSERIKYNELRVLKQQAGRFKRMTLEEVLNNPSIYKHTTLSELKTSEIAAGRNVAELKKRYGPRHPKMKQANAELEAIRDRYRELIPSIIRGIDEDYEVSRQNMASLKQQYNELKQQKQSVNLKAFELERLQQDVEGNRKLRDLFMEEYKQTSLNSSFETDRVRVVDAAVVPGSPSRPNKRRIVIMSILLALFTGIGLAFFIEYLDQTIKTSEDVERLMKMPVLGMLPELDNKRIKKGEVHPERTYTEDEKSNFSETIRTIRTGITLLSLDKPYKIILSTSSVPGEGKTTVACNLALSLSQLEKTLVFDADMRRPSTKKILGYDHHSKGMSELLAGEAEFKDVIHKVEGTNLHVITAGAIPPDPLNLLASKKFKVLLEQLSMVYDRIIIDSPPVSLVSDAVLLSSLSDAVICVVKTDDTNSKIICSALHKLRQANANIVGAVLNNVDIKKMSRYYGYGYGYGKYYGGGYYSYGEEYKS